ncbi:hypothetical protein HOA92_00780 [archaeon]|jgi:hypothetical protein|nr:hypothetical protein [archaeon]MBT6761552.1 hypothetical protein [archaeon]
MNIRETEKGIYTAVSDPAVRSRDQSSGTLNLTSLCRIPILTYGGLNTDILAPDLAKEGYRVEKEELCPRDDEDIGLRMPNVWYLNKGAHCISIPMYYNFMQLKSGIVDGNLYSRNPEITSEFGKVAMIEVYFGDKLFEKFDDEKVKYFGTPKTLTECMRVLEGWDISRVPRLADYVEFSDKIRSWSEDHFPGYDESKWFLGREATNIIREESGSTNVRDCIRFFWENYLLKKSPTISEQDIEIDIIDPNFSTQREPDLLIVGENPFDYESLSDECPDYILSAELKSFSNSRVKYLNHLIKPDGKALLNARLARKRYPNTPVVLIENVPGVKRFSLMREDEVKESFSPDVAVVADVIRSCIDQSMQ